MGHKCNHKCPSKREAEGDLTAEEGNVMTEARFYVAGFGDGGREHKPRNAALKAGKGKGKILCHSLWREHGLLTS